MKSLDTSAHSAVTAVDSLLGSLNDEKDNEEFPLRELGA
jgi:hypothetical protein